MKYLDFSVYQTPSGPKVVVLLRSFCSFSSNFQLLLVPFVQALDKMEAEWEPVMLEISPYKETGTFIMKSGEETVQMLDDHIVMTQAMSFSPYKKPFEGRIMTLENKLRTTQVCIIIILWNTLRIYSHFVT